MKVEKLVVAGVSEGKAFVSHVLIATKHSTVSTLFLPQTLAFSPTLLASEST